MRIIHDRPLIGVLASGAIALTVLFLCWFYFSKTHPDDKAISVAENEVYETVVREMVSPSHGRPAIKELVFENTVLTDFAHEAGLEPCKEGVREQLRMGIGTPPFNSLADKIYRGLTRGWDGGPLRADTIEDFAKNSCTEGPLSTAFHTGFPRAFIDSRSIFFDDTVLTDRTGVRNFRQTFPGASGIIALSHVGFSSNLREAIVSTSYVCGSLCGTGRRYILRKKRGRWEIVDERMVWVP